MSRWKTRDIHQRRMDQINANIDIALSYLKEFDDIYRPDHQNLADAAKGIGEVLILAQQGVLTLKAGF